MTAPTPVAALPYQPGWSGGKDVGNSLRDCAARYELIAERIRDAGLPRGFTVLDFGASTGYFSARLAEEFGAVCTAVDPAIPADDERIATRIAAHLDPAEITALGGFDVVLCLSVLHHHPNWFEYLHVALDAARLLFVETANPAETGLADKTWALGAAREVTRLGELLGVTGAGRGSTHTRPLHVIDRRKKYGPTDQKAILYHTLLALTAHYGDRLAPLHGFEDQLAQDLWAGLDYVGWSLTFDPTRLTAKLNQVVAATPVPATPPTPLRAPEALPERGHR